MTLQHLITTFDQGNELDLVVTITDSAATVADLGTALGLGEQLSIDGRTVDAALPISASGLVRGSRVERATVAHPTANRASPVVTLHQIGGLAAGGSVDLLPGRHAIGSTGPARSELQVGVAPSPRFFLDVTSSGDVTLTTSAADRVIVDGVPVPETRVIQPNNVIDVGSALLRVAPYRLTQRRFGRADGRIEVAHPAPIVGQAPPDYVTPPNVEGLRKRERNALQHSSHPVHATFRADLARAFRSATDRARASTADTAVLRTSVRAGAPNLWTMQPEVPLHLGYGDAPWTEALRPGSRSPEELSALLNRFSRLPSVPLSLDLSSSGLLTLGGPRHAVLAMARWLVMQSASRTDPDSLAITVASASPGVWEWTKWLPHCAASSSAVELIIVDGAAVPSQPRGHTRLLIRILNEAEAEAAASTTTVTMVDGNGHLLLSGVTGLATGLTETTALAWARDIAPLSVSTKSEPEPTPLRIDTLCGLTDPSTLVNDIVERWRTTIATGAALVPFATSSTGLVALNLATTNHTVVSGQAGSGRSTALVTLVLSLALNHPPDAVEIVLIDAGSEGTFDQLRDLPHVRTSIIGLDDDRVEETLDRLANSYAGSGVRITSRRTIIVIDDATTLAAALPATAVSLAKLGQRSLGGPHLILATRRPEGLFAAGLLPAGAAHLVLGDEADTRTTFGTLHSAIPERPGQARWAEPGSAPLLVHVATLGSATQQTAPLITVRPFLSAQSIDQREYSPEHQADAIAFIDAIREAARSVGVAP